MISAVKLYLRPLQPSVCGLMSARKAPDTPERHIHILLLAFPNQGHSAPVRLTDFLLGSFLLRIDLGMCAPKLLAGQYLCDDQILVQLQQVWVLRKDAALKLELVDLEQACFVSTSKLYRFFSSSSLSTFRLKLGNNCCSSSLTLSRSSICACEPPLLTK